MTVFLISCILAYVVSILQALFYYCKVRYCLWKLSDFVAVYSNAQSQYSSDQENYKAELTELLRCAPVIEELIPFPKLSYQDSDKDIYKNACNLISNLQMMLNKNRIDLIRSFNPICAIKMVLLFPVHVFKKLGISISNIWSSLISFFVDILLEFILLHKDAVCSFIYTLIHGA